MKAIESWFEENGYESPQYACGQWYAIAKGCVMPEPVIPPSWTNEANRQRYDLVKDLFEDEF